MKVVVSGLAGLLAALGSASANATFIYLNQGASAGQSVAGFASPFAGVAAAAAQRGDEYGGDTRASRSIGTWTPMTSWLGYSPLRRSWLDTFSLTLQRQAAGRSTTPGASGAASAGSGAPALEAISTGAAAVVQETAGAPELAIVESSPVTLPAGALESAAPASLPSVAAPHVTLDTVAADLALGGAFTDLSLVGGPAQGIPEPSTLGMLGIGMLAMFAAAGRRTHRGARRPHSIGAHAA